MEPERERYPVMREVVFRVVRERPGQLEAQAETLPIAPTGCWYAAARALR